MSAIRRDHPHQREETEHSHRANRAEWDAPRGQVLSIVVPAKDEAASLAQLVA